MKKFLSLLSLAVLTVGLLGSCSKINERIDNLEKRVDGIESTSIASVQQQIDGIKTSINDLKAADVTINGQIDELKTAAETQQTLIDALKEADNALGQKDTELEGRIATLEGQVTTIGGQIEALVNADKAINTRIDTLSTYVDTQLGKTKDWATETFATLEQYQQTADDLAALSVTVTGISTTLAGVQTSISGLDTKIDGIDTALQKKITDAKTELEGKITSLKTELEGKIADAISASETSIKSWINELLEGYYTAAQVDAKITGLNTAIDAAKGTAKYRIDSLATELTALKTAVDTAKAAIRTEYKNAIDVAINKLDGKIRGALLDSIAAVNGRVAALDTRVTALELRIQTIEGRVDNLEAAIGAYTELQGTITEIIKKLLADIGDKPQSEQDTTIWKCITALQAQCGTFGTAIETLQGLVGSTDVATQISNAIASLVSTQKLNGLADTVSALKDIVYGKGDVKSLTQQIAEINTALSTTYVTKTQLGQDIAAAKSALQHQIDSLCNVIGKDGTAETATGLYKKIAELNAKVAALEAVNITIGTTNYTNWSDAVQAVLTKIESLGIGDISGLQAALSDLDARLDRIEAMIQAVTIIPAYTDGSVEAENGTLTVDFVVSPAGAVKGVKADSIKVLVHEAKVQTKALSYMTIPVASANVDEATGNVTITADISKITPAEGKGLTVAINVKNGISNFTTEFVPVYVAPAPVAPEGALSGVFSVGNGKKIFFSQGNLTYNVTTKNWAFYEHQYDCATDYDANLISLFTWGYNETKSIVPNGKTDSNVSRTSGNLEQTEDWGSQIGDGNTWRTLTKAEWQYLFNTRSNASSLYKYGVTVCGKKNCVVLLPDNWTWNASAVGEQWQTAYPETADDSHPVTWQKMHDAGAVCLPAAGRRDRGNVSYVGESGAYWSSSAYDELDAYRVFFSSNVNPADLSHREYGCNVRLVTSGVAPKPVVPVTGVTLNKTELILTAGETETLTATVLPADATNRNVIWSSDNTAVATVGSTDGKVTAVAGGTATITAIVDGLFTATCAVTVIEYVEMKMGAAGDYTLKWATMNVGATTVAGSYTTCYGDLYQWGSVNTLYDGFPWASATQASFTWKTGKTGYVTGSEEYKDNALTLPDANDVVKQKYPGTSWRMPTKKDFEDLYAACDGDNYNTSTKPGKDTSVGKGIYLCTNYDGVAGCLFCDGTNKLFFPAAGMGLNSGINMAGNAGYYWSSTRVDDQYYNAYYLIFSNEGVFYHKSNYRHYGASIRPVSE